MNPSCHCVFARARPSCRRVSRIQNHIVKVNVITRMHLRTRDRRRGTLTRVNLPREIHKRHVRDTHQTGSRERPIVSIILRNCRARVGTLNIKVGEQHVGHDAPASAAEETRALVGALWNERTDPRLDVRAVVHILVVPGDLNLVDDDVSHARVLEILAQTADGNPVAPVTGDVADVDVVGSRLDGDAVIAALVDKICQLDVVHVHGV